MVTAGQAPLTRLRAALNRITLTRALVALGFLLVAINIASAIMHVRIDHERTEQRARRDLSNLAGLLSEQTAASLEAVDLVLRDAVRDGSAARAAAMAPTLRDEIVHLPQVAAFLVLDANGRVVGRTNETPSVDHGLAGREARSASRAGRGDRPAARSRSAGVAPRACGAWRNPARLRHEI